MKYTDSKFDISIEYPTKWTMNNTIPDPSEDMKVIVEFDSPLDTSFDDYSEYVQIYKDERIYYDANLQEYLDETISTRNDYNDNFNVISSSTSEILSGLPAYSLTYTEDLPDENGEIPIHWKTYEIGTLVNNTAYLISYTGLEDQYDNYLLIIVK